jgi:hypothetical protein
VVPRATQVVVPGWGVVGRAGVRGLGAWRQVNPNGT